MTCNFLSSWIKLARVFQYYQEKNRHGKSTKDVFLNKLKTQWHKYVFRWFMCLKFMHHIILKPSCLCQAQDWGFVSSLNISTVFYPNLTRSEQSGQRFSTTYMRSFSHATHGAPHSHFPISQGTVKAAQKWEQEAASATLHRNKKDFQSEHAERLWMTFSLDQAYIHPLQHRVSTTFRRNQWPKIHSGEGDGI